MNNLNAVLIEGILIADPIMDGESCRFKIKSIHMSKEDDEWIKEITYLQVVTENTLAQNCHSFLKTGRGVRVVGRLKNNMAESTLYVLAEHVEFKPQLRNNRIAVKYS